MSSFLAQIKLEKFEGLEWDSNQSEERQIIEDVGPDYPLRNFGVPLDAPKLIRDKCNQEGLSEVNSIAP